MVRMTSAVREARTFGGATNLVGGSPWTESNLSTCECPDKAHGDNDMSSVARVVDLTQVPAVPWAWVDEHVYAAIRGCSVKVLQKERRLNIGCPFRRVNGTTIRYKL